MLSYRSRATKPTTALWVLVVVAAVLTAGTVLALYAAVAGLLLAGAGLGTHRLTGRRGRPAARPGSVRSGRRSA